jgi:hypothetical protein
MAQMRCNCGWSVEVPELLARQPIVCQSCRKIVNAAPRVPYGYTPFQTWHPAPPASTILRITPILAPPTNTPARVAFASGGLALFSALFLVFDKGDRGVIGLALLGLACSIIGLHKSGMASLRGKGRILALHGLLFSVLALLATPLPSGPSKGRLKRLDVVPTERRYDVPFAPRNQREAAPALPPAPVPSRDKDAEQEEGF